MACGFLKDHAFDWSCTGISNFFFLGSQIEDIPALMPHLHAHVCWHIGITGGIGSGKSTVSALLADATQHTVVIDTDQLARHCTAAKGAAIPAIQSAFGSTFIAPDDSMERDAMRQLVFAQPQARKQLEAIIHPIVQQQALEKAQEAEKQGKSAVFYDIPLLAESTHWRKRLNAIVVVDCDSETQITRVMQRNKLTRAAIEAIITSQASCSERLSIADAVIYNGANTGLQQLRKQVHTLSRHFGLMIAPNNQELSP